MAKVTSVISSNTIPGPKRVDSAKPNVFMLKIDGDPTVGNGVRAPLGSIAVYEEDGVARKFLKSGTDNTSWQEDSFRVAKKTLTAAQINNMFTTPVEIVPAPGANKVIFPVRAVAYLEYNSATYNVNINESFAINIGSTAWASVTGLGFLDVGADTVVFISGAGGGFGGGISSFSPEINEGLYAAIQSSNVDSGDSPIHVEVKYEVVDLTKLL